MAQFRRGPAPARQLFEAEAGQYIAAGRVLLADLPVLLEPLAFSTLSLVVHELMTNSIKYGALLGKGLIAIDWAVDAHGDLDIVWSERGGPAVAAPRRQGLGTTIIEQSIPHELGGSATIAYDVTGLRARFVIPAEHYRVLDEDWQGNGTASHAPAVPAAIDFPAIIGPVLLVEDSMLVAIHVEDILGQLGATRVATAATVAAALTELDAFRPVLAVLDVNLGSEDSLPIAKRLHAEGIPFIFATGYGEKLALPDALAGTHILQKPYTKANLAVALRLAMQGDARVRA